METEYKSSKEVKKLFDITSQTLYNWRRLGKIKFKQINSRKVIYDISDLLENKKTKRKNVIYARVSNTKQKNDLERQISILKEFMIKNGVKVDSVYEDISSGMNENRIQFVNLINDVVSHKIDTVYITFKDRLTRFGFDYIRMIFEIFNTKIEIVNLTDEKDYQTELNEDMISIIHYFSMKMYSNRKKQLKYLENQLLKNDNS